MKISKLTLSICIAAIIEIAAILLFILWYKAKYDEPKIEIYTVYHKEAPILKSDIIIPIHAGRALNKDYGKPLLQKMIGDDTGDNISLKNERYAELTALYWIWKNSRADYVGLMHYRRYLHVNEYNGPLHSFGITRQNVLDLMKKYDVVVADFWGFNGHSTNIYQHYERNHFIENLWFVMRYIYHKNPKMGKALIEYMKSKTYYPANMFIAKKKVIDEYAEWLFAVLFAVDEDMDFNHFELNASHKISGDTWEYQRRAPAYIAERLFSFWLWYNKDRYKVISKPIVMYEKGYDEI